MIIASQCTVLPVPDTTTLPWKPQWLLGLKPHTRHQVQWLTQLLPKGQLIGTLPCNAGQMCIHAYLYECQLLGPLLWWSPQDIGP